MRFILTYQFHVHTYIFVCDDYTAAGTTVASCPHVVTNALSSTLSQSTHHQCCMHNSTQQYYELMSFLLLGTAWLKLNYPKDHKLALCSLAFTWWQRPLPGWWLVFVVGAGYEAFCDPMVPV